MPLFSARTLPVVHPGLSVPEGMCLQGTCLQAQVVPVAVQVSQHHAIRLQTACMVIVQAPVVRLLDSNVYALWP